MSQPARESFRVPEDLHEERLDRILAARIPSLSRAKLQRLVKAGRVTVAGEGVSRPSTSVASGVQISVEMPPAEGPVTAHGEAVHDLVVVYEDPHLAVIDKQAGLIAHPSERYTSGTVADLATAKWGPLPEAQGEDRPGIVHRLDRLTSGLMVIGLSPEGMEGMQAAFAARTVEKTYAALVHGEPRFDSEWLHAPIIRVPRTERLRVGEKGEGRASSTYVECRERFGGFAHIAAKPKTGRTHQIRVHLEHMGLPIIGDRLYGPRGALKVPLPQEAPQLVRQALHAEALRFTHPVTGEAMAFEAPLPEDMAALLAWLRKRKAQG
ncbi:MAG: RluA family pseudouridine synthase [Planctomycetota bacterium]|nr:RluA family pseudouridine synthase [Planctomycetota bacterium]